MSDDVIVIGGGAAGMMAAGLCAEKGFRVLLLERNDRPGRKLLITGKGRCNVTNNCSVEDFIAAVPENGRFLYGAVSRFGPQDTMAFFESQGLPLKTERGSRVFPQSDRAVDVVDCLARFVRQGGVRMRKERVTELLLDNGAVRGVQCEDGREYEAPAVMVCTGGKSYPRTGSTGDGYQLAQQAGHTIITPRPSLVPVVIREKDCREAQGLSLRNVRLTVKESGGKSVYEEQGELLFTHFGLSGPLVLSASAHMRGMQRGKYTAEIDLKPALSPEQMDARIQRDFQKFHNRDFANSLQELLPKSLIPVIIKRSGIDPLMKVHQVTRTQRLRLAELLKALQFTVDGFRPIEEAIVTSGGVCVKEVSPKTMESKLARGLYFAGEVLDVDAYTGGFNLQIAFSTAVLAAQAVCGW